jgi:hypothetical protein
MLSIFLGTITMSAAEAANSENSPILARFGAYKQQLKHNYYDCFMMSDRVR